MQTLWLWDPAPAVTLCMHRTRAASHMHKHMVLGELGSGERCEAICAIASASGERASSKCGLWSFLRSAHSAV